MRRLSIIPEILIWFSFSVIAGFGYAFACFEYISGKGQLSVTGIILPTLVWLLSAAVCTFLLRIIKSHRLFVRFSKWESVFLEFGVLLLLLIGGGIFRFAESFNSIWPKMTENIYFQYAQVSMDSTAYMIPHPTSRLYVGFLHIICKFFGNIYEIGAMIQFGLLLAGILLWYLAIRKALGCVVALFFTAGAMLLPDSITASMQCNPMMLLFVFYGLLAMLMVNCAYSNRGTLVTYVQMMFLGFCCMLAVLFDISGVLAIFAVFLTVLFRKKRAEQIQKQNYYGFEVMFACIGMMLAVLLFCITQASIYGIGYDKAIKLNAFEGLTLIQPTIESVKNFVFTLGTHPVFIVAIVVISVYWFMNCRGVSTWLMSGLLYLFVLQLLQLDTYMQHDFLIYMGLLVLLGISVQQYFTQINHEPVQEIKEKPMKEMIKVSTTVSEVQLEEPLPNKKEEIEERPLIFIPKSMEIPKRVSKPKVDFALEVEEDKMHFDYFVADDADFDIT